jgi:hypothetical protein
MPKLTLRDLFAVVTIVGLALGWWLDHRRSGFECDRLTANQERALRSALEWEDMARMLEARMRREGWEDCVWWPDPVPNEPRLWRPAHEHPRPNPSK